MTNSVARLESLMPREVWRALLASGAARRYDHGEVLMRQGDPGTYVVFLTAGHVKVSRVDPEGNEHLLVIRGPGEVVGEIAVLDGTVRSATVTALVPCITYVLASARFLRIVQEKHVEGILLRHVIARFRESEDARAELAILPAMQRITRVLLRFAAVVGGEHPELDLSQEDLAGATGLSRASVAAKLAALRRQGLIVTGRRSLIIRDLARLGTATS
jgi:CRP/FNR family transcriptional regulator, cyclic AMP receptor protein